MRKSFIVITALLSGVILNTAAAQEKPVSFGIKVDANVTNVKLTDIPDADRKFHGGASLGGFTRVRLSETFSLQPELLVGYTEAKITADDQRLKFKYLTIEIPVYVQAGIEAGSGLVTLGIGPRIGYGLSADTRTERLGQGSPGKNLIELDHWYAGGAVTAGYEFGIGISVNAGYRLGFDFASRHKTSGITTQVVSLGMGYRF